MTRYFLTLLAWACTITFTRAQQLDASFGANGYVSTFYTGSAEGNTAVLVQPNGKILAAGSAKSNLSFKQPTFTRYNTTGVPDQTFGNNGCIMNAVNTSNDEIRQIALQPDGKIVAVGVAQLGAFSPWNILLLRYNSDGSTDNSFGVAGRVTKTIGSKADAWSVALQTDGKIVVAGTAFDNTHYLLLRYNTDGTPDNSFANGGVMESTTQGTGMSLAIQPDGKILVAGEFWGPATSPQTGIARYNSNGTIDNSFGVNGVRIVPSLYTGAEVWGAHDIKLQANGKILMSVMLSNTSIAHQACIVRLLANGSIDNTYGINGYAVPYYNPPYCASERMVIMPNGNALLAGYVQGNGTAKDSVLLIAFDTAGIPDGAWGIDGRLAEKVDADGDVALAIAMQADGKIVIAGKSATGTSNTKNMVMRFANPNGSGVGIRQLTAGLPAIYPNPMQDQLQVSFPPALQHTSAAIRLVNAAGSTVYSRSVQDIAAMENIPVATLAPGIYFLSIDGPASGLHYREAVLKK